MREEIIMPLVFGSIIGSMIYLTVSARLDLAEQELKELKERVDVIFSAYEPEIVGADT
jgi:hypothetical protein